MQSGTNGHICHVLEQNVVRNRDKILNVFFSNLIS